MISYTHHNLQKILTDLFHRFFLTKQKIEMRQLCVFFKDFDLKCGEKDQNTNISYIEEKNYNGKLYYNVVLGKKDELTSYYKSSNRLQNLLTMGNLAKEIGINKNEEYKSIFKNITESCVYLVKDEYPCKREKNHPKQKSSV